MTAVYSPSVFDVQTIDQAKRVILTREGALSTDERWRNETPYLLSLIEEHCGITSSSFVLDYGCGIGRMAKALIDHFSCTVIGVDISPSMRALAASYVPYNNFFACSPEMLNQLGIKFDCAVSIWVLQHCYSVEDDIGRIYDALWPGAGLFVVNDKRRLVPTREAGWVDDQKDVRELLKGPFAEEVSGDLDREKIGDLIADASYWAVMSRGR